MRWLKYVLEQNAPLHNSVFLKLVLKVDGYLVVIKQQIVHFFVIVNVYFFIIP